MGGGSIRDRAKADLPIVFAKQKLSAYEGLEVFRRFLDLGRMTSRGNHLMSLERRDLDRRPEWA
jgi:hypothetical protein